MNISSEKFKSQILLEFNQGNKKKSLIKIKKFIKINPNDINAKLDLAYMYINLNLIKRAITQYRAILKKEKNIKAMFNLAMCFANQKKFNNCETLLKQIIQKDKNHFRSYVALGDIYFQMDNLNKATKFLKIATKLKPNDLVIFNIMGVIEMKKHNYEIAKDYFLKCIKIDQNNKSALNNLAFLYQKIGQNNDSLEIIENLLFKYPNDKNLLNNAGNILIDLNRYVEAIKYIKKAIKIDSKNSSFFSNLGRALFFSEKYTLSEKAIKKSLSLNLNNGEAHIIYFYLYIIKKDLKNAWKHFDARINVKNYFIPKNLKLTLKRNNKKILILREAGLGDEILYSSMYPDLIKKNNKAIIECDSRLKNIFIRSFNYYNFISRSKNIKNKSNLDKFDSSIYAGSLSKIFRKNISNFKYNSYLKPNLKYVEYYKKQLMQINTLPKIGISWISERLDLGKDKSISLEKLLPIFKKENISFVNLQYGDFSKTIIDFNKKHNLNIIDIPQLDKFNDIDKLLALISSLDLVLTVSNTTAHLSGSIGKKTLLLAPNNRSQLFYWMLLKNNTPWYPSIKIFKKSVNWNEAIKNINQNIYKILNQKK